MFGLVCFHLANKVHEVLWLGEKLKALSVNKVTKFVLNLDDKLNSVETVKSMISEVCIKIKRCFFGSSKISSAK